MYHELYRDRLDPILAEAWAKEKKRMGYPDNDDFKEKLTFENDLLSKLLKAEPPEVRAHVDRERDREIAARLRDEASEDEDLLKDGEKSLPAEEKERLKIVRARIACVIPYHRSCSTLISSASVQSMPLQCSWMSLLSVSEKRLVW